MDLSFSVFDQSTELASLPGDLAGLMGDVAARQGASPTACVQVTLGEPPMAGVSDGAAPTGDGPSRFCPRDGAFNGGVAASLSRWRAPRPGPKEE